MTTTPTLYSYFRSSCSWRVRIALAMKKIKYNQVPVHLLNNGGEQHSDQYKSLNLMEQVPTLLIDNITLTQSVAILEYLEETRPNKPLLPGNPKLKAKVRQISEVINSGIQPVQNLSILQAIGPEKKLKWGHDHIYKGFVAIENLLKDVAGKYCVGDEITFADILLVPQVYNATRFKVNMDDFPTIKRINETLCEVDEFKEAHYSCQPDTPDELRPKTN